MTCVLPAQSFTYREPISRAPAVELVITPEDSVAPGISIKRSNNLPFMVTGTGTGGSAGHIVRQDGENNDYSGDFRTHAGLIYAKDAAGVVTSIGPSVQTTGSDVKAMYQGDIIVGRMAMGAGTLNPAAAIELRAEA